MSVRGVAFESLLAAMAIRVLFLAAILLFLVSQSQVSGSADEQHEMVEGTQIVRVGGNRRLFQLLDCGGLCKVRCGRHSRPNVCLRACGTCCYRCKCVPPGTSGNREICGTCYTDMKTHGNKPKCP